MEKLYVYVDESGQDTRGKLFLVSVVVTGEERDDLRVKLEKIERMSKKGRRKWMKARSEQRLAYIKHVLKFSAFKGKLNYAVYGNTIDYLPRTVLTTARAITVYVKENYKASVFVDGLHKTQTKWFGRELRHLHIKTEKVRGVRREEADALMRLTDAIAGFVRQAISGRKDMARLLRKAQAGGVIKEL